MEKFVKKVKDFEEVLFASSEYAEEQLKKFKLAEFVGSSEQVAKQLKKFGVPGFDSNKDTCKDNESYEQMEEETEYNGSKNSFKREFKDSVEDLIKQDCKNNELEQVCVNGFNLRDAMIAKEILDKPLCKRRKRRRGFRGDI